jgi:hypothetical protein
MRQASDGLFFGLLPGLIAAALAGTFPLPFPALAIAGCAAAIGTCAGIILALARRIDAFELVDEPWGETFSEAVIAEAAGLMARSSPRRILGALRLPLLPFAPVLAALIALALIFPFDLRGMFAGQRARMGELAMIGEDLQSYGQRLQDSARSQNLGRSFALAQELAKLGKELAEGAIRKDEALDRMSDLERRLTAEYDLRRRPWPGRGGGSGGGERVRRGQDRQRGRVCIVGGRSGRPGPEGHGRCVEAPAAGSGFRFSPRRRRRGAPVLCAGAAVASPGAGYRHVSSGRRLVGRGTWPRAAGKRERGGAGFGPR